MEDAKLVLLADDCRDTCESLQELLSYDGYSVEVYPKFQDCLERLKHVEPCCTLIDYHMDGMHPDTFIRGAKTIRPDVPIYIVSGDHTVKQRTPEVGADGFLLKPVDPMRLVELLNQHCA